MEAGDLRRSCNTQNRDNSGPKLEEKNKEETKEHQHSEDYTTAPEDLSVSILKLHGNILQWECFKDMGWWHFNMGSG
ncbi:hypothetical protein DPX16_3770 [Anabarilius grahami]|uniref:Uncharacterized protein n=1 Tax=Anabarilius grahami TaxID=495550 RepID=A0A3N0Y011_ANAGA|nr:hypothetical protein DPX16_3770 [Anabarilius grahami]